MASSYTGNPAATQSPAAVPSAGVAPILSLPAYTDGSDPAQLYQALKVCADYIAYIQSKIALGTPLSGDSPQFISYDILGRRRWLIDHNGYPMGRNTILDENWICNFSHSSAVATITERPSWAYAASGGTHALLSVGPTTNYPSPYVQISSQGTGSGDISILYSACPVIHTAITYQSIVIEWEMGVNPVGSGSGSTVDCFAGLSDTTDPLTPTNGVYFFGDLKSATPTWRAIAVNGGTSTNTDTGVALLAFPWPLPRFRIELHGSTSTYGAYTARFFVNEALTSITTNLPVSQPLYLLFGIDGSGTFGARNLYVGPVKMTFNRFQSNPSL